jgi:molybdopterin-guanine dinucleotide biosynthesis protein A
MQTAGIILCGGKSSRMGYPKALLPFGSELLLPRVVRLLGDVVSPIVVVAAAGQELPPLAPGILVARDERDSRGPLEGLRAGLAALSGRADYAYATSCDVPLLVPAFVRRLIELAEDGRWQIVVPEAEGYQHPLSAVYSLQVLSEIEALLTADRLRPVFLFDRVPTRVIASDLLREVDPDLATLRNLNHPSDYLAALRQAGLTAPPEVLARLQG